MLRISYVHHGLGDFHEKAKLDHVNLPKPALLRKLWEQHALEGTLGCLGPSNS